MKNGLTAKFTKFIVYNFPKFNFKIIKIIWIQKINWFKFNKHDGGGKDQPLQFHWDKLWSNNYIEMQLWTSSPIRCGCIVLSRRKWQPRRLPSAWSACKWRDPIRVYASLNAKSMMDMLRVSGRTTMHRQIPGIFAL